MKHIARKSCKLKALKEDQICSVMNTRGITGRILGGDLFLRKDPVV